MRVKKDHTLSGIESGTGAALLSHAEQSGEVRDVDDWQHRDPVTRRIRLVSGIHRPDPEERAGQADGGSGPGW